MKKRRIEITVSRRRTTILLRENADQTAIEPSLTRAALRPADANLLPVKEAAFLDQQAAPSPHAILALTNSERESHLSGVEQQGVRREGDENEQREVFGKC